MPEHIINDPKVESQQPMRKKLIKSAATLFCLNGYQNTNLNEIAQACGIKKSSVYSHFSSKQELCLDVINEQFVECQKFIFEKDSAQAFFDATITYFRSAPGSQFIWRFGSALMTTESAFEHPVKNYFAAWQREITKILADSASKDRISREAMVHIQGALSLGHIENTTDYLDLLQEKLAKCWTQTEISA